MKVYRGINEFKKVHQPRADLLKDEKGDRIADYHSFFNRWVNRFCLCVGLMVLGGVIYVELSL